jgi:prepilin-type N-terminal cleavage/methylation domain-containing protein
MNKRLTNKSGFTMTELVVVIAIIGITLAIAIPSFLTYRPTMRLKGAARDITTTLQWARMKAVSENNRMEIQFSPATKSYTIYDDDNSDGDVSADTAIRTSTLPDDISYGIGTTVTKMASNNTAPAHTDCLTFNIDSCNTDDSTSFSSNGTANNGTIYLTNTKDECYALIVDTQGRIRIRKWDGSNWID